MLFLIFLPFLVMAFLVARRLIRPISNYGTICPNLKCDGFLRLSPFEPGTVLCPQCGDRYVLEKKP